MGSVLRHRNHLTVPGTESKTGLWCGDRTTGDRGCKKEILPQYYAEYAKNHNGETAHADVIVVDPPRKGCDGVLLETILKMQPERIVYVSCDSATLARDLKILCETEYRLAKVRAVDQFCHTGHVEAVCCLHRVDS